MKFTRREFSRIVGGTVVAGSAAQAASASTHSKGKGPKAYIAALAHETNGFSPIPTSIQTFKDSYYYNPDNAEGIDDVVNQVGVKAYVETLGSLGYNTQIGPVAFAAPGGPLVKAAYEQIRDHILGDLKKAMPVDVVALFLHGAMFAPGYPDCETDLVRRVRELVGPDVPIGVLLDLHCDVTDQLLSDAICVGCREYPHTDFNDRAVEIAELLHRQRLGEITPVPSKRHVRMLDLFHTTTEPMKTLVGSIPGRINDTVLAISLLHGFPWSDVPTAGAYVVVYTDNAAEEGQALAEELTREWVPIRGASAGKYVDAKTAFDQATSEAQGPVVIADVADNPGGGSAADSTFLLREILDRKLSNVALAVFRDIAAVEIAQAGGEGAELKLRIGGKISRFSSDPIDLKVRVGKILVQPSPTGVGRPHVDVAVHTENGVHIVLSTRRGQITQTEIFTRVGIDPTAMDIVVVKSTQHFYAEFAPIASRVIYCDTPGTLTSDLTKIAFTEVPRPMWPLDPLKLSQM